VVDSASQRDYGRAAILNISHVIHIDLGAAHEILSDRIDHSKAYLPEVDGQDIGVAVDTGRKLGEEGKVRVGIINHEHQPVTYRVDVIIDGQKNSEQGPIVLEHDEKWEEEISFVPKVAGQNQRVDFLLYKQGEGEVYQRLHLWVDVIELR